MNYIEYMHDVAKWLVGDVYTPPEIIRTTTSLVIAWFLGWLQLLRDQNANQRSWFTSQLLDAVRDLKRFALVTGEERQRARADGIERLFRQIDRAEADGGFLNRKQRGAITALRNELQSYRDKFEPRKNLLEDETKAWRQLIDKLFALLGKLDRTYPKNFGPEQAALANLRIPEGQPSSTQTLGGKPQPQGLVPGVHALHREALLGRADMYEQIATAYRSIADAEQALLEKAGKP